MAGQPAEAPSVAAAAAGGAAGSASTREAAGAAMAAMSYEDSELRARELVAGLRALGAVAREDAVQERIAAVLGLLEDLRVSGDRALLLEKAGLALEQLGCAPPNLILCDRLVEQLKARAPGGTWRWLLRVIVSATPHIIVALGSLLALLVAGVITYVVLPLLSRPDLAEMQLVTEAGFAGSLTSLMLRFNRWRGRGISARDAFFEGLFRPFIGIFFGWMSYYLLDAGLLPFHARAGGSTMNFYAAVAFVSGFSERMAVSFAESLDRAGPRPR